MEFITLLLSGLIGILSPAGVVLDSVAEQTIRAQLNSAETIAVRVDNAPSYQLVQGRVERVRLAGRGLFPLEGVRIDSFDIETDAIALNPASLQTGQIQLDKPLQAGVRLVVTEADLNRALQSPQVVDLLQNLSRDLAGFQGQALEQYDFIDPRIDLLEGDRLRFQVTLQGRQTAQQVALNLEFGLTATTPYQLQVVNPQVTVNNQAFPPALLSGFIAGLNRQLDLRSLAPEGITVRLLQWEVREQDIAIAAFIRVDPSFTAAQ
ncbi:MAG TPA: DUF2993 domain-containing protein [Chroococcidiopsis sp.]